MLVTKLSRGCQGPAPSSLPPTPLWPGSPLEGPWVHAPSEGLLCPGRGSPWLQGGRVPQLLRSVPQMTQPVTVPSTRCRLRALK